jgi:hypothetical protein
MKLRVWLVYVCVVGSTAACVVGGRRTNTGISWHPPATFQESDLVGTWDNAFNPGSELLTLRDDHSFQQVYDSGSYHFEGEGEWSLEYHPSGCVYIHLEGMRYFYTAADISENGNRFLSDNEPVPFWDPCQDRLIEMPDKVILMVGSDHSLPNGIRLGHMSGGREFYEEFFVLESTPTP